jgi:predicted porin
MKTGDRNEMNRKFLAIVVSSAVALPIAAQVQADEMEVKAHSHPATYEHDHEMEGEDGAMMMAPQHAHEHDAHPHGELHGHSFTLYGSVRSGVYILDPKGDGETTWDIGSVDAGDLGSGDKHWSRIGVKGSTELDGGMTAGFTAEKRLDNFRTRHQNVWLSGSFGKVTLGQQGSVYNSGVSWDNSNLFGNWGGSPAGGTRLQGISYASSLGGPFNFALMVGDDNSGAVGGQGEGVDGVEAMGTLAAGPLSIGAGYDDNDARTVMGVSVSGSFGGIGWDTGYEVADSDDGTSDRDRYGFSLDYSIDAGRAYLYYEDDQPDAGADSNYLLLGYSHTIGPGVVVIAEYQMPSDDAGSNRSAVVVKVDF